MLKLIKAFSSVENRYLIPELFPIAKKCLLLQRMSKAKCNGVGVEV